MVGSPVPSHSLPGAPRDAEFRDSVERLVAQLDARTRKDIGLEAFHGASPGERAERYRWRQEFTWPSRESTFI